MEQIEVTRLQKYIQERIETLNNPTEYELGFISKDERKFKLQELMRMANYFGIPMKS